MSTGRPGGSDRAEFARRLDVLYADAGSPPLKSLTARANRELRARNPRAREVSAQRISDWRRGTSVPARFDGLSAVLGVLVTAARRARPEPREPGLYTMTAWRTLWRDAQRERATEEPAPSSVCPYPGLSPLTVEDAEVFAGRDAQVGALAARFADTEGELLVVVGDSGVGKSSLLQAGFAARIRDDFDVLVVTPTAVGPDELSAWARDRASADRPFVLAVDQLEELFVAPFDEPTAERYLQVLGEMARTPATESGHQCAGVVVALRADFYPAATRHPTLATALQDNQFLLGPPTTAELTAAIIEPARVAGMTVGDGLVELMLTDLGVRGADDHSAVGSGTFPLLAHALRSTWEHRDDAVMSVRAYEQAGGVRGAIARSAEQQWSVFGPEERAAARTVLLELVTPVADGSAVGRHVDRGDLVRRCAEPQAAERVLAGLTAARIIAHDAYGTSLAHDAVIGAWPRLAEWVAEDRDDALTRRRIQADGEDWVGSGRDRSLLYQGTRLAEAGELRARAPAALSPEAIAFVDAGQAVRRRTVVIRRAIAVALVVGVVVTSLLAVISARQTQRADTERADAQYAELIGAAQSRQSSDPTGAAQLAVVAHAQRPDDPRALGQVLASQSAPLAATVGGHTGAVYGLATSGSGLVASGGYDDAVRLWRRDPAHGLVQIGAPIPTGSWVTAVAFSPDGATLFATGADGVVHRWAVTDPGRPEPAADIELGHRGTAYAVAVRPDGTAIATAGDDHTVRVHDLRSGQTQVLTGHTAPVRTVAFSADGATLVSGSDDRTARLWDTPDAGPAQPLGAPLTGHRLTVHAVAFSPDRSLLVTASDDTTFRLWSMRERAAPSAVGDAVDAHTAALWSVAFAPDGRTLATASWDGAAKLWSVVDPANPVPVGQAMAGSRGGLTAVSFLADGAVLTAGQAGNLQVWAPAPAVLTGHSRRVQAPAFDATGEVMATGSWDGQVRLWEVTDTGPVGLSTVPADVAGGRVENVALSPDGSTLAVTVLDSGDVALVDVTEPALPRRLATLVNPDARYAHEVEFSPDSTVLATAADDTSVQLWDLADPARPVARGAPFTGPGGWINALAFSPDAGELYAASADRRVHRWVVEGGDGSSTVIAEQGGPVNDLAISADGTLLAAAGDDQVIRIHRIAGDGVAEIASVGGHASTVRSVSFDPSSQWLASGSDDQTVRLWSLADPAAPGAVGHSLVPPGTVRWRVQFAPDGRLSGGGENGVLGWWATDADAAVERVCADTRGTDLDADVEQWRAELAAACGW